MTDSGPALVLAIWRLAIRLQRGIPAAPPEESAVLKRIAAATHLVLYLVIFGMPVTGAQAWYFGLGPWVRYTSLPSRSSPWSSACMRPPPCGSIST
jgi:cytochrome b561